MQKTTSIFIFLFLLIPAFIFSQNNSCKTSHCLKGDRGYVSFALGPSIPLGSFADNNINSKSSGFAETGSKMELNAGYLVSQTFDITAKMFYSVNGYDVEPMKKKLAVENPGIIWTTTGRTWDIYGGLIGVNYSHPLNNKLTGDVKLLTGLMNSSTPQMIVTGSDGSKITESKISATSFVYLLSAGGHYPLGRLIDITGSLEYLSSSPSFSNISKTSSITGLASSTSTSSIDQNISMLSLNFGLRVKF